MLFRSNTLTFIATDYEIYLSKNIDISFASENGEATINGKNFLNIIKRLNENEISIETIKTNIKIKQNRSEERRVGKECRSRW